MKNIYVIQNNGRLGNQLWLAASVYAYCLEKKYNYINYTFYRYQKYFGTKSGNWMLDNILCQLPDKLGSLLYFFYIKILCIFRKNYTIYGSNKNFFFPPSVIEDEQQRKILKKIDVTNHDFYLYGWSFTNPTGLEKFRLEIKNFFRPLDKYYTQSETIVEKARRECDVLVGVHIRHGDYKTWEGGKFYYTFEEVRIILNDFLSNQKGVKKIMFLICSDDVIDEIVFSGLSYKIGPRNFVADLYALAQCDMIIGSAGTYGAWAAYYGNIHLVRFTKEKINWPDLTAGHKC